MTEQDHLILQDKMLSVLLLNYIDTHHQGVHQVGFLTGHKTYKTYLLKISYEDQKNKRQYMRVKDGLKSLFDELKIENNYEFDQTIIKYLADLNHEKLKRVEEYLKREGSEAVTVEMKHVKEIGPEEKEILVRRFSRREHR